MDPIKEAMDIVLQIAYSSRAVDNDIKVPLLEIAIYTLRDVESLSSGEAHEAATKETAIENLNEMHEILDTYHRHIYDQPATEETSNKETEYKLRKINALLEYIQNLIDIVQRLPA